VYGAGQRDAATTSTNPDDPPNGPGHQRPSSRPRPADAEAEGTRAAGVQHRTATPRRPDPGTAQIL